MTTDIVIAFYGDKTELDRCTDSIKKYCTDYVLHIIDNNVTNRGFTKAVNEGIRAGKGEFIWLVNQDAIIMEGAQEGLIQRFSYGPQVGIVGSMQIDFDNHDLIRHGGTIRAFPGGVHQNGLISMGHCQIPKKQTWVNYASVMIRRSMVDKIGPLDESMFLLYSDSDYCYYARSKGYEVWYEPRSRVYHRLGASRKVTEWHEKDMKTFMKKWDIVYDEMAKDFRPSQTFQNLDMFP